MVRSGSAVLVRPELHSRRLPSGRDPQADIVLNKKDGRDYPSTRLAYRRLGNSLGLEVSKPRSNLHERRGSLNQNSSFDEFDRTFATHSVQAYGNTFPS
jgi:hypothetical protein